MFQIELLLVTLVVNFFLLRLVRYRLASRLQVSETRMRILVVML